MKAIPTPTNAVSALRLAKCTARAAAALKNLTFCTWVNKIEGFAWVDSWKVVGGKNVCDRYFVDTTAGTCTCMDFAQHRDFCKHLVAVDIEDEAAEEVLMWDALCAQAEYEAQYA